MFRKGQIGSLGLREDSPNSLGLLHLLHTVVRYYRGDLEGAEKHFRF